VLDQLPRHAEHIRELPCEDVDVLPKEADERVFLFVAEVGPDPSSLGLVTGDENHLLHLLRLGRSSGRLHGWDLQLLQGDVLCHC
jgi:hypothetical protein